MKSSGDAEESMDTTSTQMADDNAGTVDKDNDEYTGANGADDKYEDDPYMEFDDQEHVDAHGGYQDDIQEDADDEKDYNSEAGWYDDVDPKAYSFNDDYDPNAADAGVKNSTWDASSAAMRDTDDAYLQAEIDSNDKPRNSTILSGVDYSEEDDTQDITDDDSTIKGDGTEASWVYSDHRPKSYGKGYDKYGNLIETKTNTKKDNYSRKKEKVAKQQKSSSSFGFNDLSDDENPTDQFIDLLIAEEARYSKLRGGSKSFVMNSTTNSTAANKYEEDIEDDYNDADGYDGIEEDDYVDDGEYSLDTEDDKIQDDDHELVEFDDDNSKETYNDDISEEGYKDEEEADYEDEDADEEEEPQGIKIDRTNVNRQYEAESSNGNSFENTDDDMQNAADDTEQDSRGNSEDYQDDDSKVTDVEADSADTENDDTYTEEDQNTDDEHMTEDPDEDGTSEDVVLDDEAEQDFEESEEGQDVDGSDVNYDNDLYDDQEKLEGDYADNDTYAEAMDGVAIDEQLGLKDDDNLAMTDGGFSAGVNAYRRKLKLMETLEEKKNLLQEFVYHQLQKELTESVELVKEAHENKTNDRKHRRKLASAMENIQNKNLDVTDLQAFAREYNVAHVKKLEPLQTDGVSISTYAGFKAKREARLAANILRTTEL